MHMAAYLPEVDTSQQFFFLHNWLKKEKKAIYYV